MVGDPRGVGLRNGRPAGAATSGAGTVAPGEAAGETTG